MVWDFSLTNIYDLQKSPNVSSGINKQRNNCTNIQYNKKGVSMGLYYYVLYA